MSKNVFLDANILIDLNDKSRKNTNDCLYIVKYLVQNDYKIFTSCDLITTIYYILAKINKQKALENIESLNKICTIISFTNMDLTQTIDYMYKDDNFKDLEDSIQYVLALNTKCDVIISNDKSFYSPDIKLFNSHEYVKVIKNSI